MGFLELVSQRTYPLEIVRTILADLVPPEYYGWVAVGGEEIVGTTMLQPCTLQVSGKQCAAGYWTYLGVRQDYRRTALYPRLVFTMITGAAELGMDLVYGAVRRPEVIQGHLSLGMEKIGESPVMAKPVRPARLLSKHKGFGHVLPQWSTVPDYLYVQYRSLRRQSKSNEYELKDRAASECNADSVVLTLRAGFRSEVQQPLTAEAFRKRYRWNPDGDTYRVLSVERSGVSEAAVVYREAVRKDIRTMVVMEMGHLPGKEQALRSGLFELEKVATESECDVILCLSSNLSMQTLLRGVGYMKSNENYVLMMKPTGRKTECVFPNGIADWYFTFADHDAF